MPGRRFLVSSSLALLCGLLLLAAYLAYCALTLPVSGQSALLPPRPSLTLQDRHGAVFARRGVHKSRTLEIEAFPDDLVKAVLAVEDRRFYRHVGIDPRGLLRALVTNLGAGGIREGGSTITQQLAKILYLGPERRLRRKVQEAMIALWLERRLSKDEILARYLSEIYLGAGAYGVEAAARRYFDKPLETLTLGESAMLAGLIRAPSRLALTANPKGARERAEVVLTAMVEAGFLSPERAAQARAQPASLISAAASGPSADYFADWIESELRQGLGPVEGSLTLRTTLDPRLQTFAERIVADWLARRGEAESVGQAALVALAPDGAVRALVGGRDYATSQFNRATQARRQPGSLFKLFVYLAALEAGYGLDSRLLDRPVEVEGWRPKNYGGRHRGAVTLREAFAQSINSVAVQLAEAVGRENVISQAQRLGLRGALPPAPSLALGTIETSLLEITASYASLAAGRAPLRPYGIRSLQGIGSDTAFTAQLDREQVGALPPSQREPMLELLRAVVREGTGRAAALDGWAAGKTGTTQDHRDAWFVGFTADLVVGVWVGNDDAGPMKGVTGGGLPARIWRDFMAAAQAIEGAPLADADRRETIPEDLAEAGGVVLELGEPGEPFLRGRPWLVDTGSLRFGARLIRLAGVEGRGEPYVDAMRRYIAGREVVCQPFDAAAFRCEVGGYDLSEVVLFNGGGRALADAPPELLAAEQEARHGRVGIWGP